MADNRQIDSYTLRNPQPIVVYHSLPPPLTARISNEAFYKIENSSEEKPIKIVCISDTHNGHRNRQFSDRIRSMQGDILIHAGDFSESGSSNEVADVLRWLHSLNNFTYKIFISGNMDGIGLDDRHSRSRTRRHRDSLNTTDNVIYLENKSVTLMGINIYGCPYTPKFVGGFQYKRQSMEAGQLWDQIPENCDILICHGPPASILDESSKGEHVGCQDLREAIFRKNSLKAVIFGHVHHSYGVAKEGNKWFINAAQYNGIYYNDNHNKPIELYIRPSNKSVCGLMGI